MGRTITRSSCAPNPKFVAFSKSISRNRSSISATPKRKATTIANPSPELSPRNSRPSCRAFSVGDAPKDPLAFGVAMSRVACRIFLPALILLVPSPLALGQDRHHASLKSPYGTYGDNGLPFFGQTLDARKLGVGWPSDNLTPRGIVLHLGFGYQACFDPDLLRLALLWKGTSSSHYLSMNGMAPGSYRQPNRKSPSGQDQLPLPLGKPVLANGLYPGVQIGETVVRKDPRSPGLDSGEPGLGPLPGKETRWLGLRLDEMGPVLTYQIEGTRIEEEWAVLELSEGQPMVFRRTLKIAPHRKPLTFALTSTHSFTADPSPTANLLWTVDTHLGGQPVQAPPHSNLVEPGTLPAKAARRIWKEEVRVPAPPGRTKQGSLPLRGRSPSPPQSLETQCAPFRLRFFSRWPPRALHL